MKPDCKKFYKIPDWLLVKTGNINKTKESEKLSQSRGKLQSHGKSMSCDLMDRLPSWKKSTIEKN